LVVSLFQIDEHNISELEHRPEADPITARAYARE